MLELRDIRLLCFRKAYQTQLEQRTTPQTQDRDISNLYTMKLACMYRVCTDFHPSAVWIFISFKPQTERFA